MTDDERLKILNESAAALHELTETALGELERGIDPRLHRMPFWDSNAFTLRRLASIGRVLTVGGAHRLSDSGIRDLKRTMRSRQSVGRQAGSPTPFSTQPRGITEHDHDRC